MSDQRNQGFEAGVAFAVAQLQALIDGAQRESQSIGMNPDTPNSVYLSQRGENEGKVQALRQAIAKIRYAPRP